MPHQIPTLGHGHQFLFTRIRPFSVSQRCPFTLCSYFFGVAALSGRNGDMLRDVRAVNAGHAEEPNSFPLASDPRALCSDRVPVFPRCALNALEMCVSARSRSHDPAWVSSAAPGRVFFVTRCRSALFS